MGFARARSNRVGVVDIDFFFISVLKYEFFGKASE